MAALIAFADSHLGQEVPSSGSNPGRTRRFRFIPFLDFGPATRGGDLHHQQHRVIELPAAQDHPGIVARALNDAAVIKLLWLAIRNHQGR